MIRFRRPAIAGLKFVRAQIEGRLRENQDYLALLAIDDAIVQFDRETMAETEAVFRSWARQQPGGGGEIGSGGVSGQDNEGAGA